MVVGSMAGFSPQDYKVSDMIEYRTHYIYIYHLYIYIKDNLRIRKYAKKKLVNDVVEENRLVVVVVAPHLEAGEG